MLELGDKSEIYHRDLSKVINNSDIDKVFVKGEKLSLPIKIFRKKNVEIYFSRMKIWILL